MKKTLALLLTVLSLASFAEANAQVPPSVSPVTKTQASKPLTTSQQRMKDCAAQYKTQKIPSDQYKPFMSKCLKIASANETTTPASTVPAAAPMSTIAPAAPATPSPAANAQH